jgi:lipoprotein-anchoring transpeptidase ErfK/SrfK
MFCVRTVGAKLKCFLSVPRSAFSIAIAGVVVAGSVGFVSSSAEAQFSFFDYRPSKVRRVPAEAYQPRRIKRVEQPPAQVTRARRDEAKEPSKDKETQRPLYAVVSLEDQHVSVYGANGLIERADVSTGTEANPTPTGVFAIIQKERWHESNLYSGAPMPFMQRVTWSGVAMHQGQLPGYPASHGCVRLSADFAQRWFGMTKLGLRVIISPTDIEPKLFSHPSLPVPRVWTIPSEGETAAERLPVQSAGLTDETLVALAAPTEIDLNPVTYAIAAKARAKYDLKESERAEGELGDAAAAANAAAKAAAADLKIAERGAAAARDRLAWFGLIGNRAPPSPRADFGEGLPAAIANNEQATSRLSEAQRLESTARENARAATEADQAADARTEALKLKITEMTRRQETVSIFISRKDGRLYVRQALRPVLDIPIAITDPDQPLGTHVYVALPPAAGEKAMRWSAMSLPFEPVPPPRIARAKRGSEIETGSIAVAISADTATTALDRIHLAGEVLDQLAEYVWAGSSVIISDHGITHETGVGTDFIIQTKH